MPISWDTRNKCWRYQFKRTIEGKRHRASRLLPRGWSQAQADAFDRKESARLYAVASGVQRSDPLIEVAVAHYLRDKTQLKSYRKAMENLAAVAWAYEGKTFAQLPAVASLINGTREGVRDGVLLSDATAKQRIALLKAACRWGWKQHDMCEHDPTTRMQMPTVRNERHVYKGRDEMLALAKAADRHDLRALIRVAFYTGLRKGELRRAQFYDGALHLEDTKNGTRRSVPVHPKALVCMRYVPFTAPQSTLDRAWQRARALMGMEEVHLHDLRHSTASAMINEDVDLYTVGAVLGHMDPRSTQRYAHLTHRKLADAVGKIGRKSSHNAPQPGKKKATG
jgi:integrase